MIRPIDIKLNAAHPELPLVEATTFTGAPSSVFIRGVPKAVGNWSITAVSVAVTYPDNTTTARAAVESAEGVWVATIPGTATSGRTAAGFKIMADGIDENGAAVTGYVLGFADFSVLSFTPVPAPGGTFYLLRYFDQAPAIPKEGDVAKIDGVLKFYNGSAWEPFAAPVTLDNTVTRTSGNGVKSSGIWSALWGALASLPTGFLSLYDWAVAQLAGKQSSLDVARVSASGVVKSVSAAVRYHGATALLRLLTENTAINGKTFTDDVTLTGADIPVDATQGAQKINAALAGKLDKSGGMMTGDLQFDMLHGVWFYDLSGKSAEIVSLWDSPLDGMVFNFYGGLDGRTLVQLFCSRPGRVALAAPSPTVGNLAALDANGNPTDSGIAKENVALQDNIPYSLGTPIVIDTASSETVEGETVTYAEATLANRTANIVQVTAATALDELRITFPAATSGKVRDFGLRVEIGTGSAALTAPALIPIAPTGETIKIENSAAEIPALADGTATAKGVTLLYFSETSPGVFVVKGEQVEEVA